MFDALSHHKPVSVTNVKGGLQGFLAMQIFERMAQTGGSTLFLTPTDTEARARYRILSRYHPESVCYLPPEHLHESFSDAHTLVGAAERQSALLRTTQDGPVLAITSMEAILKKLTPPEEFKKQRIQIKTGEEFGLAALTKLLADYGYERMTQTEAPGQFSVRGDIVDAFLMTEELPVRFEFFDDEVESIRVFYPATQRSEGTLQAVELLPVTENFLNEGERSTAMKKMKKLYGADSRYGELIEKITVGGRLQDGVTAAFLNREASFLDYLDRQAPDGTVIPASVVWSEPTESRAQVQDFLDRVVSDYEGMAGDGEAFLEEKKRFFSWNQIDRRLKSRPLLKQYLFSSTTRTGEQFDMDSRAIESFAGQPANLAKFINNRIDQRYSIRFFASDESGVEKIQKYLKEIGVESLKEAASEGPGVRFSIGEITEGFELAHDRIVFLNESDFFKEQKKRRRRSENTKRIDRFTDLKIGDYVVHDVHGIGLYKGIVQMDIDGVTKDLMHIQYAGDAALYIPVEQMNAIQVYIGTGGDVKPKISRMGSPEWQNAKRKAKKAVEDMADELIELYARRSKTKGYAFGPDTAWQQEFEDAFPYDETDDQLKSIEDIKADMRKPVPMDRLLCGDVGYGKTEVALRAAFKAAMDGKQTALLVPTTVLSQQHFQTATARFKNYPVKVEVLSRFRSPAEQKQILKDLRDGRIDLIIGTHRLLSKDVVFKDLGLLIVDEEQRFGVRSKEKIKQLKSSVDVLTLSATPIPRTLHMSLTGVRDMSVLEEPPAGRRPVQTYVMGYSPTIIRDAIDRELARQGQIYYIHNRVHDIESTAGKLKTLVPHARIVTAHGQMSPVQLEKVMERFLNKEYDILIATTIVESGLDVKNANTMIIEDGDCFGLSQLYQLRGRVGRSEKQAYTYITHRKQILTDIAAKRLKAIRDFTAFGSGFKIALRDLEIRGAGNLLGSEQSGHLAKIGYELYTRILEETVTEKMTGALPKEETQVNIQLHADAYIPEGYISDEALKYDIYRKLSCLTDLEDHDDLEEELTDRFGDIPQPVYNLMMTAMIKNAAAKLGASEVVQRGDAVRLVFAGNDRTPVLDAELFARIPKKIKFRLGAGSAEKPIWTFEPGGEGYSLLKSVYEFIQMLNDGSAGAQEKGEKI